jgi:hypothetical protein
MVVGLLLMLAHPAVLGRSFALRQQIAAQEKGGHHSGEVDKPILNAVVKNAEI